MSPFNSRLPINTKQEIITGPRADSIRRMSITISEKKRQDILTTKSLILAQDER